MKRNRIPTPALDAIFRLRFGPVHTACALTGDVPLWWANPRKALDIPPSAVKRDIALQAAGVKAKSVKIELHEVQRLQETRAVCQYKKWKIKAGRLYPLAHADYKAFAKSVRGRPQFRN